MANSNEIIVKVAVDESKAIITPPTAAANKFQPVSPVTESADTAIDILGQGEQIISKIPSVGEMYSKTSSLISQAQTIGNVFATASVTGLIGLGVSAVVAATEKAIDYVAMKRQTDELQRRAGLNRGQ